MSEVQSPTPEPKKPRPPQSRRRRFAVGFWVLLTNFVLAVLVIYVILSVTETSLGMPQWVVARVEAATNSSPENGNISIGRLNISVNDQGRPSVSLGNVGIFDKNGAEVARLNTAFARFSALDALRGEISLRQIQVSGAQIVVRRRTDGQFDLSFGAGAAATGSLPVLLDSIDTQFEAGLLSDVEELLADDLTITLEDARSGRLWQITDGRLALENTPTSVEMSLNFDVFNGTVDLAETEVNLFSDKQDSSAILGARFRNASSMDVALQSPIFSFLSSMDAPISGAMRSEFASDGTLADLNGTLEIGEGLIRTGAGNAPFELNNGRAYFAFSPKRNEFTFSELSFATPTIELVAGGKAYLNESGAGWPTSIVAQMDLRRLEIRPSDNWSVPLIIREGVIDAKLSSNPFQLDIGQFSATANQQVLRGKASLNSTDDGLAGALDANIDTINVEQILSFWPERQLPGIRDWLSQNVASGNFSDLTLSARRPANEKANFQLNFNYADSTIRVMPDYPLLQGAAGYGVVTEQNATFAVEAGQIAADDGQTVDLTGSVFQIPDLAVRPMTATLQINAAGRVRPSLYLLSLPPINALEGSGIEPDFADGMARVVANVSYPMKPDRTPEEMLYQASGVVTDVSSDQIIDGKLLTSRALQLAVNKEALRINGPFAVGDVAGEVAWEKKFGPDYAGISGATGTIEMSQSLIDEFDLGLPDTLVSGDGEGEFEIELISERPPKLTLQSDLLGVGLSIPQIGWRKRADATGNFRLDARLASVPRVPSVSLTAPGLSLADGSISFDQGGAFQRASFGQVVAGDWLSGPVSLVSRGSNLSPRIEVQGGRVDTRKIPFGSDSAGSGDGSPIAVSLDRLVVSDTISLTGVNADLNTSGGLSGRYTAELNGGVAVNGQLETVANGVAIRMRSGNGGAVLRDAGIFPDAFGGDFDMTLSPGRGDVRYRGTMSIKNTRVLRASVLTELLQLVSVVGLLDQMRGAGILFSDVDAEFEIRPNSVNLLSSSAVGPSMGISLQGIYDLNRSIMNMQGVLSPVYFLNAIGQIVSPRRGEGLFGFNFSLSGTADSPTVQVNPLSILTPGAFREIFRAAPPEPNQ